MSMVSVSGAAMRGLPLGAAPVGAASRKSGLRQAAFAARHRRRAGFTLVEVVVALTLLSLILLGLVSALRSLGETGSRLEGRSLRSDDVRLVPGFLRQAIGSASPRLHVRPTDMATMPWFEGASAEMVWVGNMPARQGVGGLHHLRLAVIGTGGTPQLMLQYLPFVGDDMFPDWALAPSQLLVAGVDRFELGYQRAGTSDWLPEWADPQVLPGRVRMLLSAGGQAWPEMVFSVVEAQPGMDPNAPSGAMMMQPGQGAQAGRGGQGSQSGRGGSGGAASGNAGRGR